MGSCECDFARSEIESGGGNGYITGIVKVRGTGLAQSV